MAQNSGISWTQNTWIIGGESGNDTGKYKYRPCLIDWIDQIAFDCRINKVPVFVKQTGTYISKKMHYKDRHGANIDEWRNYIRVRQFPIPRA